jgi:PAS domain S-box-containing protein
MADGVSPFVKRSLTVRRRSAGGPSLRNGGERALEAIKTVVGGGPLQAVLDFLCRAMEAESRDGVIACIHPVDETAAVFRDGAAPSLPAGYLELTNGMRVESLAGPCCHAVATRKPVVVHDLSADAKWSAVRDFAAQMGLRACWSTPIFSSDGKVLGTFAHYYREPRDPSPADERMAALLTHSAGLAIERSRSEEALRASEARFRELADHISQFAWTADHAGSMYWFNQRWYDYTGTTLAEVEGWKWRKVHHPDHVDRVVDGLHDSFASGTPWEDTFPLRGKDGSYRWFLSRAMPIRDEAGNLVRWFGTHTDVTKEIEAERALRELNETLEHRVEIETRDRILLWNVSLDLMSVTDADGRFLSINSAWKTILGWTADDLLSKSWSEFVHPDDIQRTIDEFSWAVDPPDRNRQPSLESPRFENRWRHRDGSYRWITWRVMPQGDRVYATGRDVTGLKEAASRLRQAQRELAHVSRRTTVAAMTASIAHEVSQPLAAIAVNGNALLRALKMSDPDLDDVQAAVEQIVADSHRANDILGNIRAMFRKEPHAALPLHVNDLIHDVLAIAHGDLVAHGVVVRHELDHQLPRIIGERASLQQVLLNLIGNAMDAMAGIDDRPRLLHIRSERSQAGEVAIVVADQGTGVGARHLKRIFEPFFTTKPLGMGMGLSICRSIVTAHGGHLSAARGEPYGAVFTVHLPIARTS